MKLSAFLVILSSFTLDVECFNGFTVLNHDILDANGRKFVMRGINHEHTWYKSDIDSAISSIASYGVNIVRIVLADGDRWTKDEPSDVAKIIQLCEDHGLVVMLEVHDPTGSDDLQPLQNAVDYWKELKSTIEGKEDRVIINIANEWYGTWETSGWAEGYKIVIKELRDAGFEHLLVVDCAGYGQYPESLFEKGDEVFQVDRLNRTVLSIHMYDYAGGDADNIKRNIDKSLGMKFPVIIGEFGDPSPKERPTDVDTIIRYSHEKEIGWIAWSWYGNSDPILDLTNGPSGGYNLTAYGHQVVNGIQMASHHLPFNNF